MLAAFFLRLLLLMGTAAGEIGNSFPLIDDGSIAGTVQRARAMFCACI